MKLKIKDSCLRPKESIKVSYKGKDPFRICKALPRMFKGFFKVEGKDIREQKFKWDISGDPIHFFVEWEVKKEEDDRTDLVVGVEVSGNLNKKNNRGDITVKLKGYLTTEYEYKYSVQKSFIWLYQKMFYNKQREEYLYRGRRLILELREEIKGMAKLLSAA